MEAVLHRSFLKNFKKLPKEVRFKFFERRNLLLDDPFHPLLNNHSVEKAYPDCRSINITGDYRAIFFERGNETIFIRIGTHSDLY